MDLVFDNLMLRSNHSFSSSSLLLFKSGFKCLGVFSSSLKTNQESCDEKIAIQEFSLLIDDFIMSFINKQEFSEDCDTFYQTHFLEIATHFCQILNLLILKITINPPWLFHLCQCPKPHTGGIYLPGVNKRIGYRQL